MIDAALPRGRVVSVRRLRGGLDAYMHAVSISFPGGERTTVVLRRAAPGGHLGTPEQADAEYRTLTILSAAGVPAPRPLLLDGNGLYFGCPSILMSYDGRPVLSPRDMAQWLADLAGALLKLETITPSRSDLTFLDTFGLDAMRESVERPPVDPIATDPLARQVAAVLRRHFQEIVWPSWCLVHRDFWPGNTIWRQGRLSAIIDWSTAAIGDSRIDVAQCRVDLAMMHGIDTAESFLVAFNAHRGAPVCDIWFFDLLCGLSALAEFRGWLIGYHDIGLTYLSEEIMEKRLREFLALALCRAGHDRDDPAWQPFTARRARRERGRPR